MRVLLVLFTLLGTGAIGLSSPGLASADSMPVTLAVTPDSLLLAPGESAQVIVTASIPVTTVHSITLSAHAGTGVTYTIHDPARTRPPIQGDLAWTVEIARTGAEQPAGKVHFRADYQLQTSDGQLMPGIAIASLDVQDRTPDAVDKVIRATIETALDTIQDQQSRQVYVVVENISRVPVTVTGIAAWPIPNIDAVVEDLDAGWPLAPQQSHPFSMTLTAGDSVQPGKHLLVVQVDTEWTQGGQRTAGSLVLNKEFQAGVFGESAILAATGIPSLLLLPGFLFLTGLLLFVKWSWGKTLLELDFKKPPFWYWAITISLVAVWLYPFVTGPLLSVLLGRATPSRDLVQGYGFNDILMLWLGAVLLGFIVWAVGSTGVVIYQAIRKAYSRRRERLDQRLRAMRVPSEDDRPIDALTKLANNGKTLDDLTRLVYPKGDPNPQVVFGLPTSFPEEGKTWVAPGIVLHLLKQDMTLQTEIDELGYAAQDFGAWLKRLGQTSDAAAIQVDWDTSAGQIRRSTLVDEDQTEAHVGSGVSFWRWA
jgi:hypothetical protein